MSVYVSLKAAKKIRETLDNQNTPDGGLRLGVKGGGCSGLSYVIRNLKRDQVTKFLKNTVRESSLI